MSRIITRWLPAPAARPRPVALRLMTLEDRMNPAYLFVDFGDRFAFDATTGFNALITTEGGLQDVAPPSGPNNAVLGPTLTDSNGTYAAGTRLDIRAQTFTAADRAAMMAVVTRAYLPLNVTVVDLTATNQTTADGRTVRGAATMADVISTLHAGNNLPTVSKDAYIFAAQFVVDPLASSPTVYGPNGGGTSPGAATFPDTTDLTSGQNNHDDVAVVFTDTSFGFNYNTMNNIAHEAGHCFGLLHAISNNTAFFTSNQLLIPQAEIMSYVNSNDTSSSMFTRFPQVKGDSNTSYNTIEARNGTKSTYDQLTADNNVKDNPLYRFISGTGAYDIITVTKDPLDPLTANVTVQAFADAAFTVPIVVPGQQGQSDAAVYSYTVRLDRTLLIETGDSDDRVVIDGDLGVNVQIDGMFGSDTLVVNGNGAASATYTPNSSSATSVDRTDTGLAVLSYGGVITVAGGSPITFSNYRTSSAVTIQNVTAVTVQSPGGADQFTLATAGGLPKLSGTVNGGTAMVPLLLDGTVDQLVVDASNGDAVPVADRLSVDFTFGNPAPAGGVVFNGGSGADTLRVTGGTLTAAVLAFTGPAAGSMTTPAGGLIAFVGTETVNTSGTPIAALTVALPAATNAVALEDDGTVGNVTSRIRSTTGPATFPTTLFRNASGVVTLLAGSAADTLAVAAVPDFTSGLTVGTAANPFASVAFNGAVTFASNSNLKVFSATDITLPAAASDLTLSGTGTIAFTAGRKIVMAAGSTLTTTTGSITLSANAGATPTAGSFIGIDIGGTVSAVTGGIALIGRGGTTGATSVGVSVTGAGLVRTTNAGAVAVAADTLDLGTTGRLQSVGAGGTVTLLPFTAGTPISVGGADVVGSSPTLGLSAGELSRVTTGTLAIGSSVAGTITLAADIAFAAATNIQLTSGADLTSSATAGRLDTGGGTLELGIAGALFPLRTGADFVASRVTSSPITLAIGVTGTTPGSGYSQLTVTGDLYLTGFSLAVSGPYVPAAADTFTVVSATNVFGTFGGQANGLRVNLNGIDLHLYYSPTAVTLLPNRPPVGVSASGPYVITAGDPLTVSAAVATDPDSDPLTYTWDINGDGAFGDEAFGTASADRRTVSFTPSQLLSLGLGGGPFFTSALGVRVSDGLSFGTTAATTSLTINPVPPPPPPPPTTPISVTAFNVPRTAVGGVAINLSAAATDPPYPTDPLTYIWTVTRGQTVVASGAGTYFSFTPAAGGSYSVSLLVSDVHGRSVSAAAGIAVTNRPQVISAVGPIVSVRDVLTDTVKTYKPFGDFTGAVSIAQADLNADGVPDLVVAAGGGGGPRVRVLDGASLAQNMEVAIADFFAYSPQFTGGVNVAAVDGEIVVGAAAGGGPHVKVISAPLMTQAGPDGVIADSALLGNFFAFAPNFYGGVSVAVGDQNGDGVPDVVVGAGTGGGPHVKVIDGTRMSDVQASGTIADTALQFSTFVFDTTYSGGVTVAAAAGRFAVGMATEDTQVRVFDGPTRTQTADFVAYPGHKGGVRVGFADEDANGTADLLTGAGPGGGPHVRTFNIAPFVEIDSRFVADPADPRGVVL